MGHNRYTLPSFGRRKYRDPDFDDGVIEGLMRYFRFVTCGELRWFLGSVNKDRKYSLPRIPRR